MGIVFLIVAGAAFGWLALIIAPASKAQSRSDTFANIAVGILGALLAGLVVSPRLGTGSLIGGYYTIDAVLITMLGSILALTVYTLWRRQIAS